MSTSKLGGASISARARTPSIDLASLAELLAKAVARNPVGKPAEQLPFVTLDAATNRLRVNLRGVLGRLLLHPDFKSKFSAGEETGLMRDVEFPPQGFDAKMGGKLLAGSDARTTASVEKLHKAVSAEIDEVLAVDELRNLVIERADTALSTLAERLGVRRAEPPLTAALVPIEFTASERKTADREHDVARVLTAIEVVEGRDWLEKMLLGAKRKLESDEVPEEEIVGILDTIRMQRTQPVSQIRRFLDFLDDEALARVRLQVTFELMEAVAAQSSSTLLREYVARVRQCFDGFGGTRGDALPLDVSKVYGQRNCSDLADHLRKATFYHALPVWPEGSVQLFEARVDPEKGFATKREVSYRFRVNGQNPETGKSAFASRLDRIEERLLDAPGPESSAYRALPQLVFLRLVTPPGSSSGAETVDTLALAIAAKLKNDPVGTVRELVLQLRGRERVMDEIAHELVRVLQTKARKLVDTANRTADKFYITVHKNIVDWTALTSMSSTSTEVLVKNERGGHDNIAWFEHLIVSDDPASIPGALASYQVETRLVERSITPIGERVELQMARDNSEPVLPIRLVPFRFDRTSGEWTPEDVFYQLFDMGCGVDLEYELRPLSLTKSTDDKANLEQLRTASCTAFALVAYLVLWEVVRRLKTLAGMTDLAAYLLRLQPGGRGSKASDGNAAVYTISHAIERALCRELPVKMQGFHTGGDSATDRYRKTGSLVALQGGFPVDTHLHGPSSIEKVALVTYVTRPCDMHPKHPDADGFLFVSRTYRADQTDIGFKLYADSMQSRLVDTRKQFREPQLILEEIARLRHEGYHHVILLSHHFGNRHIGRAAERHSPHGTFEFLEDASQKFPDVFVYPLRRDVFPATRLHKRLATESAFEVLSFKDHEKMLEALDRDMLRSLMPVYTFATLAVVSADGRPQSGFCTYFLDVEQRLSNWEWSETMRQNITGFGEGKKVREALIGLLRALHYLESEKSASKNQVLPVLDPFSWATPTSQGAAGELPVMERRGKGSVLLSFPAVLAHVTKVLHKDAQ